MKKLFLLICLLAFGISNTDADPSKKYALTITFSNGNQTVYQVNEKPEILWEGDSVLISTQSVSMAVEREQFAKFTIGEATGVRLQKEGYRVTEDSEGNYSVEGLSANETIQVYNGAGQAVNGCVTRKSNSAKVRLKNMPSGIYMIKSSNHPAIKVKKP